MASYEDVEQGLLDGIARLSAEASSQKASTYAFKFAAAANQLAEARAWLLSPAQSHGGVAIGD